MVSIPLTAREVSCTEKNATESVTVTKVNSFGNGSVRGHMACLPHLSRIFTFFSTRFVMGPGIFWAGRGKPLGASLESSWRSARSMRRPQFCASKKTHTTSHTSRQFINQSTNQQIKPINQSTNQPINQSTNQPINQSINQPNSPTHQLTNSPTHQLTNQSIQRTIGVVGVGSWVNFQWVLVSRPNSCRLEPVWFCPHIKVRGRNGADRQICRLRKLLLPVMPFLSCLFPLMHSSAQHSYGFLVCCNFEGDHIDSMTASMDAEVALARSWKGCTR